VRTWHSVAEVAEVLGTCADDGAPAIHAGVPPASSSAVGTSSRASTACDGEAAAWPQGLIAICERLPVSPERWTVPEMTGAGTDRPDAFRHRAFQTLMVRRLSVSSLTRSPLAVDERDHRRRSAATRFTPPFCGGVP
jgi:hypothetical protein